MWALLLSHSKKPKASASNCEPLKSGQKSGCQKGKLRLGGGGLGPQKTGEGRGANFSGGQEGKWWRKELVVVHHLVSCQNGGGGEGDGGGRRVNRQAGGGGGALEPTQL